MPSVPNRTKRPQATAGTPRRKDVPSLQDMQRADMARRDSTSVSFRARFTSYATYIDLVRYSQCLIAGGSETGCYAKGDNGIGASGKRTATTKSAMCALPRKVIIARWGSLSKGWGKPVICNVSGHMVICSLEDIAPNGVCDLNPGALEGLTMDDETELDEPGTWQWGI